ncbi:MAG: hypothetical protein PVF53_06070, partial [Desulfobacterales bacterium]
MIKRVSLILIILMGFYSDPAPAQQTVSVAIMPFDIHAQEDLSYLEKEIPQVVQTQLEQEGARVLVLDALSFPTWKSLVGNFKEMRKIGQQTGAGFIVWGSLTWIGQNYSLDAKLLASLTDDPPLVFSAEGEGIENLPATVEKLVQNLA